jgi:glycosyltransferase involved in cell wall biosynthesis
MTPPKLKIVHVLTRLLRAGSEENTLRSCAAQAAAGHEVWLVHGRDHDPSVAERAGGVAKVVRLEALVHPISPLQDVRAVRALSQLLRTIGPDVVHTHQSKAGVIGRIAARMARSRAIVHGVHILPFVNTGRVEAVVYTLVERICAAFTDGFIHVSPSVQAEYEARGIGAPERHFVVFSAMDIDKFRAAAPPDDWRSVLGVAAGADKPPTGLMLAAFEPRKRQAEFVRAIPEAFAHLGDWRMVFAGEGPEMASVQALVREFGLEARVRFTGYREDPEALIALADVCVLTSMREGLPRVVVQYAAAGKPIVSTQLPGLSDILGDEANAWMVGPDDVTAAAAATAALLADVGVRAAFAAKSRSIDVDRWSPIRMARDVDIAYAAALAAPLARARGRAPA